MATAVYFIPPVRYLLFRASAAFFLSANSLSLCEWRVAISRRLFGRRLREGGGFSVASAMASCSAATQASLVFPFGNVPSKRGTPAMPSNRSPSLSTCVEINQSFLGDDAAVLAPSSGEEPASPRHRAGVAYVGVEVDAAIQHEGAVKF